MNVYVLKNQNDEYLCYDYEYDKWYAHKDMRCAQIYVDSSHAKPLVSNTSDYGNLELYKWEIRESKEES